jgi:hypothetical protein
MRPSVALALLALAAGPAALAQAALAQPVPAPALPDTMPQEEWVPRQTAELQALDKVTARISRMQARVGQPERFGSLTITVRACHARPPDEVPDAAVWLEIADSRPPANGGPVFRGWMLANAPGVHMLEHPVYDIRVLDCH